MSEGELACVHVQERPNDSVRPAPEVHRPSLVGSAFFSFLSNLLTDNITNPVWRTSQLMEPRVTHTRV